MTDDAGAPDPGSDALPPYAERAGDAEEAVTVSISTAPGEWLVNTNDSVVVPMSMAEVVQALRSGRLTDRCLVWRSGMQEWLQVERVPQLKLAARLPASAPRAPRLSPPPKPPKSARATTAPHGTPSASISPEASSSPSAAPPSPPPSPSSPRHSRPPPPSSPRHSRPPPPSSARHSRPPPPSSTHPSRPPIPRPATLVPREQVAERLAAAALPEPPSRVPPRTALPPPPGADDGVLAVYDRPTATISFELIQPASVPPSTLAPETLAPTTTESVPSRPPMMRNADLSVVAAAQFRAKQRSWRRLIWVSSLASAAAASLLTFLLSGSSKPEPATAGPTAAELPASRPTSAPSTAPTPPPPLAATPAAPTHDAAPSKPKTKRKARAWHPPRVAPVVAPPSASSTQDPSTEANPYDVKLTEDPPTPTKPSESQASPKETSSSSDKKPDSADSPSL
jgi:hypothetical protein